MVKGKSKITGKIFSTKDYGDLIVLSYEDNRKVKVKFLNTGYETYTQHNKAVKGTVKDHLAPCVFGVGITEGLSTKDADGKTSLDYNLWCGMLERCYSEKYQLLKPTYKGCTVSDNFTRFSYFREWCNKQVGFGVKGFRLDKDILVKGNKVYSETTCCFVPYEINSLLSCCGKRRGKYPIGVSFEPRKGLFQATVSFYGRNKRIGYYNTTEEAFQAYKQAKEGYIKEVANKWKDQIDPRAYEALMNWTVEITD